MSNVTVSALLREQSVLKVTTRWHTTNQTDGSSAAPYCIAMQRQKENDMVCAQNLMISGNDGKRNSHIDDGERPAATTNDRGGQSKIYQQALSLCAMGCTMVLVSCWSARFSSSYRRRSFTLSNDERRLLLTKTYVVENKSRLTMTVNNGRLRQSINSRPIHTSTLDYE